jgi:hypothetical protein
VNPVWYSGCTPIPVCTNPAYGQCGGVDSDGVAWLENHDDCCPDGFQCSYSSAYYSQCLEKSKETKGGATKAPLFNFARAKAQQSVKGYGNPTDTPCKIDADCTIGGDPHCVKESDYYSACVDCTPTSFASSCTYMSGSFLAAAEATCDLGCDGRCPTGSDDECADNANNETTCVATYDVDACVDCSSQAAFDEKCTYMSDDWVIAAQKKCGLDCTQRCPTHDDADCSNGTVCVVQPDGYFDQCVDCAEESFEKECKYWSDEIRSAAELKCGLECDLDSAAGKATKAGAFLKGDDGCANAAWDQCGGTDFKGDSCCPPGYDCTYSNDYYSGCSLEDLCLVVQFGQCGGVDEDSKPWPEDQQCCPDGFECSYTNPYYSQCVEKGSNNTDCAGSYEQCGGSGYTGTTCCTAGYECTEDAVNPVWYSGCTPIPVCTNPAYGQCGGVDSDGVSWMENHDDCCPDGFYCSFSSVYYSQCLEETGKSKK